MRQAQTILFAAAALMLPFAVGPALLRSEPPTVGNGNLVRYTPSQDDLRKGYERAGQFGGGRRGQVPGVYKSQITPHWFANNTRFWYRNDLKGGTREFMVVDAEHGRRGPAFDHAKLAASLSTAAGKEYKADKLPFDAIEFADDGQSLHFKVEDTVWACDLTSYACAKTDAKAPSAALPAQEPADEDDELAGFQAPWFGSPQNDDPPAPQQRGQRGGQGKAQAKGRGGQGRGGAPAGPVRSPDEKWTAVVKDSNVYVRPADGGEETRLSDDGKEGLTYGQLQWSPDSKNLVAFRIEPGDRKEVYLIESSPKNGGRAKMTSRPYALPGDKFATYELNLFSVADRTQTKPKADRIDFERYGSLPPRLRWKKDGRHFTYQKIDRGHQRFRLMEVDVVTGADRTIIDEKTDTFIWTAHIENVFPNNSQYSPVNYLNKTDEVVYVSEQDGWRHLYLVDCAEGRVKNQITKGNWVVRGIDTIDEDNRQIWFRASGKNEGQDPYLVHYYRVNFDGTGLVALTEGNGSHSVQYSPDEKYLVDTYSRLDMPPVHELRRASDGGLVCDVEKADISELQARGWEPPEVFVAKARDGVTDIWGVINRPRNLDPTKLYPVIEDIYAGPQGSFVPKTFSGANRWAAFNNLGFVVAKMDGMGTANRSKKFHDVCWKNLADAGFPDRILWHKAVAAKYPWYDISRVGITGSSAGGQNSTGGVLFHSEFYKVAVSGCGCHDNRMDKASWNEQWMGYPVGPQYAACSNVDNAHRLRGKLLLIVGELDTNVPPESTLRVVDALIKANKDFDMLVVPGAGHGMGGAYGSRRQQDYFVRHLHGVEPPERNAVR
jgi:dipeptidyl aminopeptidase/acylaminoacyl peptidase